jgi:hypothetical protein
VTDARDWQRRLREQLEPVLLSPDPRPGLSAYRDMPCALFLYPPAAELDLRREVRDLVTRLHHAGKRVSIVSLAHVLAEALERAKLSPERLAEAERRAGLGKTIATVHQVVSQRQPIDRLVADKLAGLQDPSRDIAFLVRAGALYPFSRPYPLVEHLMGRVQVPTVLFYPGQSDGAAGLSFLGVLEAEHNYRVKIF